MVEDDSTDNAKSLSYKERRRLQHIEANRRYKERNREKIRADERKRYYQNVERTRRMARERARKHRMNKPAPTLEEKIEGRTRWLQWARGSGREKYLSGRHRTYLNSREKRLLKAAKSRLAIVNFLGAKCVSCGYSDIRALHLDHIKGHGYSETKKYGSYYKMIVHYSLNLETAKTYFQVLCANCNWIKRVQNKELLKF